MRRKETLLGITGKESIKKENKDYDEEVLNFGLAISRHLMKVYDDAKVQANIKEIQTQLRQIQEEDKNINTLIEKHLSMHERIIRDNANPFTEDIIQYAKMVPLQLLIIGRPKSGKSTLAKAIAAKYNLVLISFEKMVEKLFERSKFFE
jgi:predicted GTPase